MIKFLPHNEIEALAAHMLDLASRKGAWGADLLYSEGGGSGLTLKDGETEECVSGSSAGIGIRTIMSDGRQGIAYGSRLDRDSVDSLVEWSLHNALASEPEEGITLYDGPLVRCEELEAEDRRIREITAADRMKYCLEMTRCVPPPGVTAGEPPSLRRRRGFRAGRRAQAPTAALWCSRSPVSLPRWAVMEWRRCAWTSSTF